MPSANSSQRIWWLRLCALTWVLLSLTSARSALAAAPMCGVHAQTVAAPPIGTPASNDALTAENPCEEGAPLRAAGVPNREAPQKISLPEQPLRALPILPRLATCPLSARLSNEPPDQDLLDVAFARSIYRPPRA